MAEVASRVKVQSKLTVVSSMPIGPGKTHRLSGMDQAMGLHTLHTVFYYRFNPFLNSDLTNFRVSLSELLSLYPAVTGRLARAEDGDWVVKCNDAGVRMIKAKVSTTVDDWLRSTCRSEEQDLTVWEDMPDDPSIWSPFRIQINDFEGGGLAIGLSCTHMHADLTSLLTLIKSWSELHRGEPISHHPVFHCEHTNTKPTEFYSKKSKAESPLTPAKMATATFRFSGSVIKQCLSQIHATCPGATPFDALAALFWTKILKLKPHIKKRTNNLSICLDFRKLVHPTLPLGYFGNALHFSQFSLDSESLEGGILGHVAVAGLVHHHLAGLKDEELRSTIDWFESKRSGQVELSMSPFIMYGPELTCVSLDPTVDVTAGQNGNNDTCRSLMYEAMFKKDEGPVHVSCHVGNAKGEGLIMVLPSPDGGLGRTVTVMLPEEEIDKLCEDQDILDLEPTMIMNERR